MSKIEQTQPNEQDTDFHTWLDRKLESTYLEGYEIGYGEGRNHMRDDIIKACEQYEFNVQGLLRVIKDL